MGLCVMCHENWKSEDRCCAGAIQNITTRRLKGGESVVYIVSSLVDVLKISDDSSNNEPGSTLMFSTNHDAPIKTNLDKSYSYQIENKEDSNDTGNKNGMSTEPDIATQHIPSATCPKLC